MGRTITEIKPLVWEDQERTVTLTNKQWLRVRDCIHQYRTALMEDINDSEDVVRKRPDLKEQIMKHVNPCKRELEMLDIAQKKIDAIR